jgi:hypothetical protein
MDKEKLKILIKGFIAYDGIASVKKIVKALETFDCDSKKLNYA